jgi:hypothetical protein
MKHSEHSAVGKVAEAHHHWLRRGVVTVDEAMEATRDLDHV